MIKIYSTISLIKQTEIIKISFLLHLELTAGKPIGL